MSSIGILGGTFDPVHHGHLRLAEEARQHFSLTDIRFIPPAVPPHRGTPTVSWQERIEMVRIAISLGLVRRCSGERGSVDGSAAKNHSISRSLREKKLKSSKNEPRLT